MVVRDFSGYLGGWDAPPMSTSSESLEASVLPLLGALAGALDFLLLFLLFVDFLRFFPRLCASDCSSSLSGCAF